MLREKTQGINPEVESIKANVCGGPDRISVESSVMEEEQRVWLIQ